MVIREQTHRLTRNLYKGKIICALTLCVHNRKQLFVSESLFNEMTRLLLDSLRKNNCSAHIYMFMPNHAHLLVEGLTENADIWKAIVNFKQRSGYWLSQNNYQEKWQKDFYDHILRKDEDILKQVRYILDNPRRRKLVREWKEYPFKGSMIYNFNEWEL